MIQLFNLATVNAFIIECDSFNDTFLFLTAHSTYLHLQMFVR